MRKTNLEISSILISTLLIFSCVQETEKKPADTFTVSGTIKDLDTEFMNRSYRDENGERAYDSIKVSQDYFTYTAKISEPTFNIIWPNVERTIKRSGKGYYPAKSSQLAFLASPGDHIIFKGEVTDFINAYPSGTTANEELASCNSKIFPLLNQSVNLLLQKEKLEPDDPKIQILEDSIQTLDDEVIRLKKEFIVANPKSEAATWYLSDMMLRSQIADDEAILAFKAVDQKLKDYPFYKEVESRIMGIESTQIGKIVPDFTTNNTMDGSEFQFNSLKGKYVLIDFWGTWCGPCVAEMPKVKAYQEKYIDKLTVLGINSGDSKEKIEEFVNSKKYDWKQIIAGEGEDNLVLKFNVAGFPTKFIIDPTGKILYRFTGDGEESFATLDELLN